MADPNEDLWFNGPAEYDELPDITRDRMLSDQLRYRYGTKDPKVIAELFHQELGLSPYRLRVAESDKLLPKYSDLGAFQADPGRVISQSNISKNSKIATQAHELAHAADEVFTNPWTNPEQSNLHHGGYRNFEPDLADSVQEQRLLEAGVTPDERILAKNPWLRALNKKSSNKLATPWSGAPQAIPPDIYNATRTNDRMEKLYESLDRMHQEN